MAKALGVGIAQSYADQVEFQIADPSDDACLSFEAMVGQYTTVSRATSNQEVAEHCDVVFLAVKPQFLNSALHTVSWKETGPLIVSIIAGVGTLQLERITGSDRIIRVMPNTPCLIGQGASAIAVSDSHSPEDVETVRGYLEAVGKVVTVEESMLDSVTGLSGSGPAYVFSFIDALIDGAVLTGMARSTARELAVQTVIGASMMVEQTGEHTAVLRDRVTSPGGTTIAGLKALEENAFRDSIMSAVQAATDRSMDLGD